MKMPNIGKPKEVDPYAIEPSPEDKKKTVFFMFGGLVVLAALFALVFTSGGNPAGQATLKTAINQTGESIGIINEYEKHLKNRSTQNDAALIKIILSGNYEKLVALYKTTNDKKTTFSKTTKPDIESQKILDTAVKNDTVDSAIFGVIKPKIITAQKSLIASKADFSKPADLSVIQGAQQDLDSVLRIIEKAN